MLKAKTIYLLVFLFSPAVSMADYYDDAIDQLETKYLECVKNYGYQSCKSLKNRTRNRAEKLYHDKQVSERNSHNRMVYDCYQQASQCNSNCSSQHGANAVAFLQCSSNCLQEQKFCSNN